MTDTSGSTIERTVYTYKYLRAISWISYQNARKQENERFNNLVISMLFSAFCMEAFLNHVGKEKISYWSCLQRGLKPEEKLEVISSVLDFHVNNSERPFSSFGCMFKLRNLLVHAETVKITANGNILVTDDLISEPLSKWEEKITIENGKIYLDDTKSMIERISKNAGYKTETVFEIERPIRITTRLGRSSMPSS